MEIDLLFTLDRKEEIDVNFKPNGSVAKIAFGFSKTPVPDEINRCVLVAKFLFGLLAWSFIFITRTFGWVVRIVGAPIAFLGFGYKPAGTDWRFERKSGQVFPFVPINNWPKWKKNIGLFGKGEQVAPFWVIFFFALVPLSVLYLAVGALGVLFSGIIHPVVINLGFGTLQGQIILGLIILFFTYRIVRNSEPWQLLVGAVKAKKERWCPIDTFE